MNSSTKRTLRAALSAVSLFCLSCACGYLPARADESGWVLTQRSSALGDQYVYLTASGIKIINPRQGIGFIIKAPNWDVLCFFNDQTRSYYPLSYAQWKAKLASKKESLSQIQWTRGKTSTIAGLRATQYQMKKSAGAPARGPNDWLTAEYWVANEIKVSPKLADLLSTVYGTPDNMSVPLKLIYKTVDGRNGAILDTYRQQITSIPASYFSSPTGYQLAKSEVAVMVTNEHRQLLEDLAKDLGRGDTTSLKKSKLSIDSVPAQGLTLPNGTTVSKEQINGFIDAFKQSRRANQQQ